MLRIRLLIDTVVHDDEVTRLAERIAEQEVATVQFDDQNGEGQVLGGRLMGAQEVQADV